MANVYGNAILDHINNPTEKSMIEIFSPDFEKDELDPKYLMREYLDWPDLEKAAVQWCKGKVLDVGALAGIHSEYLISKGFDVTALELDEVACQILKQKNIKHLNIDVFTNDSKPEYDTILLLMNGLGIGGSYNFFEYDIEKIMRWLKPGGQLIADSSDLVFLNIEENPNKYYGELEFKLQYKNYKTKSFNWLYIDFENAKSKLATKNIAMEMLVYDEENNHYLSRIFYE